MKQYFLFISILIIAIKTNGQSLSFPTKTEINTMERTLLKDSIGLTDDMITKYFDSRDQFFTKIEQYRLKNYSDATINAYVSQLTDETNSNIRKMIGEVAYQKLTQLIQSRMKPRRNESTTKPLAHSNN